VPHDIPNGGGSCRSLCDDAVRFDGQRTATTTASAMSRVNVPGHGRAATDNAHAFLQAQRVRAPKEEGTGEQLHHAISQNETLGYGRFSR
jgi:hypothetical protein